MTLLPDTLAGRTIVVLLAGLVISNLIGLLIFAGERNEALSSIAGTTLAQRIAAVVRTVERTSPPARVGVICSQSGPGFTVTLTRRAIAKSGNQGWQTHLMRSIIANLLDNPAPGRLRLSNAPSASWQSFSNTMQQCMTSMSQAMPGMMDMQGMRNMQNMGMTPRMKTWMQAWRSGNILQVSYRLGEKRWLNFSTASPKFSSLWKSRFFLAFFVMAVVVSLLSVWAVRRSTAPLALFAWAAERLGRDVNAPDLPEDGPREVHQAARAFNEMQHRLRRLINDRTQMLAAISHDLRTPITRLRLRAEFVEDTEQRGKMLNDLEQMEEMIAATLAFARDDNANEPRKNLDLAGLLQSICDDATDMGHEANFSNTGDAPFSGRPLALRRAFTNLVDNAIKYGSRARVHLKASSKSFVITIDDEGPGIPDGEIERVFEPFYRIEHSRNRETGGTGLGLAVVRSIIRGHGGEVKLSNRPEGGLCVRVILPRTDV